MKKSPRQEPDQSSDEQAPNRRPAEVSATIDEALVEDVDQPEGLAAQFQEQKDRFLRLQAEMQNLRQRTSREIAEERRYAALPIMRDILPVVDNIERAIQAAETEANAQSLLEGFRLVRDQLISILAQNQCEPIDAEGATFDPGIHEAILQQPSAEHPAGTVTHVAQQGYRLHDRVVRPTQVIVSSGPAE